MEQTIRLNKFISESGFCSRRKADEWIASGRVSVNGVPATLGTRVAKTDEVRVGETLIRRDNPFKMVAFYKPKGYACTAHRGDKSGIFSHFDLDSDLKYVGRLDKDSEGLLLLTNDGDLCNEIAKAANYHEKEYVVTVNHEVTKEFINSMRRGVRIYDANKNIWVTTRECTIEQNDSHTFTIILTQGLNRQIRRMCEALDYKVVKLRRIRVVNIEIGTMKPGEIRKLTEQETEELKKRINHNAVKRENHGETD